jgi:hypothetical protein
MNQEQLEKIAQEMLEMFNGRIPNPEHSPKEFEYYVRLYKYEKKLNESNRDI